MWISGYIAQHLTIEQQVRQGIGKTKNCAICHNYRGSVGGGQTKTNVTIYLTGSFIYCSAVDYIFIMKILNT